MTVMGNLQVFALQGFKFALFHLLKVWGRRHH